MTRPVLWLLVGMLSAPPLAYLVFRLTKALGFLEAPADRQHELRRTILVALFAFLLFLPVLIFGFGRGWPRAWVLFGIFNAIVLLFFAWTGILAALQLWRLRFPAAGAAERPGPPGRAEEPMIDLPTSPAESDQRESPLRDA